MSSSSSAWRYLRRCLELERAQLFPVNPRPAAGLRAARATRWAARRPQEQGTPPHPDTPFGTGGPAKAQRPS